MVFDKFRDLLGFGSSGEITGYAEGELPTHASPSELAERPAVQACPPPLRVMPGTAEAREPFPIGREHPSFPSSRSTNTSSSTTKRGYKARADFETERSYRSVERIKPREPDAEAMQAPAVTMARQTIRHPPNAWTPVDTLNKPQGSRPSWLSSRPATASAPRQHAQQILQEGQQQDCRQLRLHTLPVAYQESEARTRSPHFPESASKRQKLDTKFYKIQKKHNAVDSVGDVRQNGVASTKLLASHPIDATILNGQSSEYRALEDMMRPSSITKPRSRSRSRSKAYPIENPQSLLPDSSTPNTKTVKHVCSTHETMESDGPADDVSSSPDELIKEVHSALFDDHRSGTRGNLSHTSPIRFRRKTTQASHEENARREDVLPKKSSREIRRAGSFTPEASFPTTMSAPAVPIEGTTDRLRDKFKRDPGIRRASTDHTDPLQTGIDDSQLARALTRRARTKEPQQQRKEPTKAKAGREDGDGFLSADDDSFVTKDPRKKNMKKKARKGAEDATHRTFDTNPAHFVCSIDIIIDNGMLHHEQISLYLNKMFRRYTWVSIDSKGLIELDKITRADISGLQARLTGPMDRGNTNIKNIVFPIEADCLKFRASLLNLSNGAIKISVKEDTWLRQALDKDTIGVKVVGREEIGAIGNRLSKPYAGSEGRTDRRPKLIDALDSSQDMTKRPVEDFSWTQGDHSAISPHNNGTMQFSATERIQPRRDTRSKAKSEHIASGSSTRHQSLEKPTIKFSQTGKLGEEWQKPLIYPPGGKRMDVTTVEFNDLERLDEEEFLNDNTISFGLKWAIEKARPEVRDKVHCFNTYFYSSLTNGVAGKSINYEAVKKWTSRLATGDLFQYKYIIVPINQSFHWHVAIICNVTDIHSMPEETDIGSTSRPDSMQSAGNGNEEIIERKTSQLSIVDNDQGLVAEDTAQDFLQTEVRTKAEIKVGKRSKGPVILTLDSFGGAHSDVVRNLKQYLKCEASAKRAACLVSETMPTGVTTKGIPLQSNFCDCGLYLLAYVERFLQNPEEFVRKAVSREMNEETDWPNFDAETLRDSFRDVVLAEGKRQNGMALTAQEDDQLKTNSFLRPMPLSPPERLPLVEMCDRENDKLESSWSFDKLGLGMNGISKQDASRAGEVDSDRGYSSGGKDEHLVVLEPSSSRPHREASLELEGVMTKHDATPRVSDRLQPSEMEELLPGVTASALDEDNSAGQDDMLE